MITAAHQFKRPMLAVDADWDYFEYLFKSGTSMYASPKLDGIRATNVDGIAVSRTLKPIRNQFIQSQLNIPEFHGLDGELIVGSPVGEGVFNRTTSGVMSAAGRPDFTYYVFDKWDADGMFHDRLSYLDSIESGLQTLCDRVKVLPQRYISNIEDLKRFEEAVIVDGYEGVICKWIGAPYKQNRSTLKEAYMLKLKRFEDREAVVVGFEELNRNMNEATTDARGFTVRSAHKDNKVGADTLGKLLVRDTLKPEWEFAVGTGFDFATRDLIWANQDDYHSKVIKYKYLPIGTIDKPRHPVFLGFRHKDDISGEP